MKVASGKRYGTAFPSQYGQIYRIGKLEIDFSKKDRKKKSISVWRRY